MFHTKVLEKIKTRISYYTLFEYRAVLWHDVEEYGTNLQATPNRECVLSMPYT
jgi:hypothetical protein